MNEAARLHPPAMRARRVAVAISVAAAGFSLGFGFALRRAFWLRADEDLALWWLLGALSLLLVAMLLRIVASLLELFWLERTWTNLPESFRRVGPLEKVDSMLVFGLSFVPVLAWFWKLGLVVSVANGLEGVRRSRPFEAPVPRRLGVAAVMFGWVPGLNLYVAPFLWEMFARRIDAVIVELGAR